ncbi:MAG: MTAP family purine nucleoside phosphorylase, partial [Actinomycetia bacterium]|nr:MTAP family purine nucleoside phosphorylase [Actinomycetes bacterium]
MSENMRAEIGVFGGSGFYSFLEDTTELEIKTPYGDPSDKIVIGEVSGKSVAFMPRHGRNHGLPPHMINFRANIYAMKELGVKYIFGPCASGSLQPHIKPGQFVICDQFVDRTKGRRDTFFDGPKTVHIAMAKPYCPDLR